MLEFLFRRQAANNKSTVDEKLKFVAAPMRWAYYIVGAVSQAHNLCTLVIGSGERGTCQPKYVSARRDSRMKVIYAPSTSYEKPFHMNLLLMEDAGKTTVRPHPNGVC